MAKSRIETNGCGETGGPVEMTAVEREAARRERRKEYLREYYRANREKAREYQRKYNLAYRKKQRVGGAHGGGLSRPDVRHTFTIRDIMQLPTEKAAKAIDLICRGERMFTM